MSKTVMRRYILLSAFTLASVVLVTIPAFAQSSLNDLKVSEAELKENAVEVLVRAYVPLDSNRRQAFKAASESDRVTFVHNVFAAVKAYTESEHFRTAYANKRASANPTAPVATASPDEQYAEHLAKQRKELDAMKADMAKMQPEMREMMKGVVEGAEQMYQQQANNPEMVAMMKQEFVEKAKYRQQEYEEKLSRYADQYPVDPKVLIASRLHEFIELTNDIPYGAKLEQGNGGGMTFADPSLESKSYYWKLCYRAGKKPVETARELAKEWLKQLEK